MKLKQFNFKKVKSTNLTAIRLIKSLNNEFGMIISEAQSKGKGQYGRKWISYKGNIFLSFFYKLENINLPLNSLTKKNCLLVKKVISKYYKKKITFKSPNDLLINKKKICGILQETIFHKNKKFVIIGIGINIHRCPEIPGYPTAYLNLFTKKKLTSFKIYNEITNNFEFYLKN